MKKILSLSFILFAFHCSAQNLKKLITDSESDSIQANYTIYKTITKTDAKNFEEFEGTIGIVKLGKRLHYFFVGESKRFGEDGILTATMITDSLGYLQSWYETDPKHGTIFDCVYEYKRINGILYMLESQRLFYGPNQLAEAGRRYRKMTEEGIGNRFASSISGYGQWTYYTRSGEVEKIKDYGELK